MEPRTLQDTRRNPVGGSSVRPAPTDGFVMRGRVTCLADCRVERVAEAKDAADEVDRLATIDERDDAVDGERHILADPLQGPVSEAG